MCTTQSGLGYIRKADECHPESKAASNGLCFKFVPPSLPLALSLIDYNLQTKISPSFHKLLFTVVFTTATKRQTRKASHRANCTSMFLTVLVPMQHPTCPSTDKNKREREKMWSLYTTEFYSIIKIHLCISRKMR